VLLDEHESGNNVHLYLYLQYPFAKIKVSYIRYIA